MSGSKYLLLVKRLNDIEVEYPVEELIWREMEFWPIIKVKLFFALTTGARPARQLEITSVHRYLFDIIVDALKLIFSLGSLRRCDSLFSSVLANCRFILAGRYFDYYVDPIIDEIQSKGIKTCLVDLNPQGIPYHQKSPARSKPFHANVLRKSALLFAKLAPRSIKNSVIPVKWDNFFEVMGKEFQCSPTRLKKDLVQAVLFEYYYSRIFKFILFLTKPKTVYVTCFYSRWGEVFACRQAGMEVVDVQHGAQGEAQVAYSFWKKIYNTVPTQFWTWSEKDKADIQTWGGNSFVGGLPFALFLKRHPAALSEFVDRLVNQTAKTENVKVLVTLQPGYDTAWLTEILKIQDFFFFIRTHPLMSAQEILEIQGRLVGRQNWEMKEVSSVPIVAAILSAQLHVTCDSAATKEAALFGVKTICLSEYAYDLFPSEIATGAVSVTTDISRLKQMANSALGERLPQSGNHVSSV